MVECIDNTQRTFSIRQTIPVIGPILFSPIKALTSLVEIIMGIALSVIFLVAGILCCCSCYLYGKSIECITHTVTGTASLIYSLANILTLGILGYVIETGGCKRKYSDLFS